MPKKSSLMFVKDPPRERHRFDWDTVAVQLRKRPGEWALIFKDGPETLATSARNGVKALPLDEFEFRTADNKRTTPRTCTLYARYIPKEK